MRTCGYCVGNISYQKDSTVLAQCEWMRKGDEVELCVRAESILSSYLLAKEARSPKSGIVRSALFFPNHTPNLALLKYRNPNPDPDPKTKEVPKVTSENLFER